MRRPRLRRACTRRASSCRSRSERRTCGSPACSQRKPTVRSRTRPAFSLESEAIYLHLRADDLRERARFEKRRGEQLAADAGLGRGGGVGDGDADSRARPARHRPQQHGVDDAEDGGVGADAERDRQRRAEARGRGYRQGRPWSGAIGGAVSGVIAGSAVASLVFYRLSFWTLALALLLSVSSQIGDLFESFIKRRFGVKDSSHLIPGHGGFMDRVDGLVFACFTVFLIAFVHAAATGDVPGSGGGLLPGF